MRLLLLLIFSFSANTFATQSSRTCEHSLRAELFTESEFAAYFEVHSGSEAPWYEDEPRIPGSGSDPDGSGYTGDGRGTGEDNSGDVSDSGRDSDSSP